MSTAFPGGVDSFPDPVGTDLLDNAAALLKHATQHTNVNDAVNAIETQLNLTGLLTGSGVPAGGTGVNTNLYLDTASGIIYRKTAGTWAAIYTPAGGGGSGADLASALGVTTMPRSVVTTTWASGNQSLTLTGFVPQVSFTAARIKGVAAATTTPTSAWLGIYSVNASGDGTLIATTANTPAIGTAGAYSVTLVTPVALTAGGAYVLARLGVGAGLSGLGAPSMNASVSTLTVRPFCSASLAGQTTLPASFTFASLAASTTPIYNEVTI